MTPPIRSNILSSKGLFKWQDLGTNEHLAMVKVVGGVMTPPYNALTDSPLN